MLETANGDLGLCGEYSFFQVVWDNEEGCLHVPGQGGEPEEVAVRVHLDQGEDVFRRNINRERGIVLRIYALGMTSECKTERLPVSAYNVEVETIERPLRITNQADFDPHMAGSSMLPAYIREDQTRK